MLDKVMYLIDSSELETVVRKIFQEVLENREHKKEDKLFTKAEAAELLSVDRTTLWRWEKAKYLVPVRIGSKAMYKQSDIEGLCRK